jgi:Zn-dependent protease
VNINTFLLFAPVLLFSMVAHELAHGFAALRQGDPTAYRAGRLTWNPIKHLHPVLSVLLPLLMFWQTGVAFGGARPVPVDPRNFRNYRRGDIIVSLAGVSANLAIALLATLFALGLGYLGRVAGSGESLAILQLMCRSAVMVNLSLVMFNLLPIPPLDGSRVMRYLLPPEWALRYQQWAMYGFLLLVLLVALPSVGRPVFEFWMGPAVFLWQWSEHLVSPVKLVSEIMPS